MKIGILSDEEIEFAINAVDGGVNPVIIEGKPNIYTTLSDAEWQVSRWDLLVNYVLVHPSLVKRLEKYMEYFAPEFIINERVPELSLIAYASYFYRIKKFDKMPIDFSRSVCMAKCVSEELWLMCEALS